MAPPTPKPRPPRQVIPRPPSSRPGGQPPWADLGESDRRLLGLNRVRDAIATAAAAGSNDLRPTPQADRSPTGFRIDGKPAAGVLVPLYEVDGETRVILTVRSSSLSSHRAEVAFPGGRLDPGESAVDAALRESHEEIGLDPETVFVLGTLSTLPTASSNTLMTPVVGILSERPLLVANTDEVSRIFDVALAELLVDGVFHEERWRVSGSGKYAGTEFRVWFFEICGEMIWGATARVLMELLRMVLGLDGLSGF